MDLGVLCPCLVTMQPLLRHGFVYVSSQLSPRNRSRMERATGLATSLSPGPKFQRHDNGSSSQTRFNSNRSLRSKPSKMEEGRQWYDMEDLSWHPMPENGTPRNRDADNVPVNQEAVIASLDPRAHTTSSHAQVESGPAGSTPHTGIGVAQEWRLTHENNT